MRNRNCGNFSYCYFIGDFATLLAGALALHSWLSAQDPPASAGPASSQLIEDLVGANRILASENVVDAYGHVELRIIIRLPIRIAHQNFRGAVSRNIGSALGRVLKPPRLL